MKKFMFVSMIVFVFFMTACGSEPQRAAGSSAPAQTNPFGDSYEAPCQMYDDDDYFAATGIYKGSMEQKGELQKFALVNAQTICRMKVKHTYRGMVSDFAQSHGNNRGNDIETKISQAGDQIIDAVINDTQAKCVKYSGVGADGRMEAYVGIKINKRELAGKVADAVKDALTDEEKTKIDFHEDEYRKQMEERFEKYREEHKN